MGFFGKRKPETTIEFVGGSRDGDQFRALNPAPTFRINSPAGLSASGVGTACRSLVYLRRPGQPDGPLLYYDFFRYGEAP